MTACNCGPYWSVVPPGPCPVHAPQWVRTDVPFMPRPEVLPPAPIRRKYVLTNTTA